MSSSATVRPSACDKPKHPTYRHCCSFYCRCPRRACTTAFTAARRLPNRESVRSSAATVAPRRRLWPSAVGESLPSPGTTVIPALRTEQRWRSQYPMRSKATVSARVCSSSSQRSHGEWASRRLTPTCWATTASCSRCFAIQGWPRPFGSSVASAMLRCLSRSPTSS